MTSALAFLLWRSAWNATRVRLSRLKQIRYALATAAGLLYFYWIFGHQAAAGIDRISVSREAVEVAVPLLFFALVAWRWITPRKPKPALGFTPAEVHLLFPSPLRRSQLIGYRIARMQLGNLGAAAMFAFVSRRSDPVSFAMTLVGLWMAFSVIGLHDMGVSLLRAGSTRRGGRALLLRWVPVLIVGTIIATIAARMATAVAPHWSGLASLPDVAAALRSGLGVMFDGWLGIALWPFRALVHLPAAESVSAFVIALPAVLFLWALCAGWVLMSDTAFEEASAEEAERISVLLQKTDFVPVPKRRRAPLFKLAPTGRVEMALLWKNLIASGRVSPVAMLVTMGWFTIVLVVVTALEDFVPGHLFAILLLGFAVLTAITGPMQVRFDLRQDLARLVILKSWPMRGSTLVRGEVLAPILVLGTIIAICLIAATALSGAALAGALKASGLNVVAWCVAAILLSTGVVAVSVIVQNGLAVLFPAWVQFGPKTAGGIAGMGQIMVFTFGSFLLIPLAVIPAALAGLIVWAAMAWIFGSLQILIPALAATVTLAAECWVATEAIGAVLDRTDISAIDPA